MRSISAAAVSALRLGHEGIAAIEAAFIMGSDHTDFQALPSDLMALPTTIIHMTGGLIRTAQGSMLTRRDAPTDNHSVFLTRRPD